MRVFMEISSLVISSLEMMMAGTGTGTEAVVRRDQEEEALRRSLVLLQDDAVGLLPGVMGCGWG